MERPGLNSQTCLWILGHDSLQGCLHPRSFPMVLEFRYPDGGFTQKRVGDCISNNFKKEWMQRILLEAGTCPLGCQQELTRWVVLSTHWEYSWAEATFRESLCWDAGWGTHGSGSLVAASAGAVELAGVIPRWCAAWWWAPQKPGEELIPEPGGDVCTMCSTKPSLGLLPKENRQEGPVPSGWTWSWDSGNWQQVQEHMLIVVKLDEDTWELFVLFLNSVCLELFLCFKT